MTTRRRVTIKPLVNPAVETSDDPYRAPEAPLLPEGEPGVISDTAMHSLVSTKWWMRMAALALMVNGVGMGTGALWVLLGGESPAMFKLILFLLLLAAGLVFMPGLRLMQSSLAVGRAAQSRKERDISHALARHEEFWKWLGLAALLIGGVVFYVFMFVIR